MIMLGYLAYPSFKLSEDRKHQIFSGILESITCEAMYTLSKITNDDKKKNIIMVVHSYIQ